VVLDDSDFEFIGNHVEGVLEDQGTMLSGTVGHAPSRLIPMRSVVDLAGRWLADNRTYAPVATQSQTW
jgi:aminoglycoside N3'-acetyltransferase